MNLDELEPAFYAQQRKLESVERENAELRGKLERLADARDTLALDGSDSCATELRAILNEGSK